jgi:hypothetical protein
VYSYITKVFKLNKNNDSKINAIQRYRLFASLRKENLLLVSKDKLHSLFGHYDNSISTDYLIVKPDYYNFQFWKDLIKESTYSESRCIEKMSYEYIFHNYAFLVKTSLPSQKTSFNLVLFANSGSRVTVSKSSRIVLDNSTNIELATKNLIPLSKMSKLFVASGYSGNINPEAFEHTYSAVRRNIENIFDFSIIKKCFSADENEDNRKEYYPLGANYPYIVRAANYGSFSGYRFGNYDDPRDFGTKGQDVAKTESLPFSNTEPSLFCSNFNISLNAAA